MIKDFKNKRGDFINSLTSEINSFSVKDLEEQFTLFPKLQEEFNHFKLNFTDSFENGWDKVIEEYKKTFPEVDIPKSFVSKKNFLLDKSRLNQINLLIDFLNKANFFDKFIYDNNVISESDKEKYSSLLKLFSNFNSLFGVQELETLIELNDFDEKTDLTIFNNTSNRKRFRIFLEEIKETIKSSNLNNLIKSIKDSIFGSAFNFGIFIFFDKEKKKILILDHNTKLEFSKITNNENIGLLSLGFVYFGIKQMISSDSEILDCIIKVPDYLNFDLLLKLIKEESNKKFNLMMSRSLDLDQLNRSSLSNFPTELMTDKELSDFIKVETSILDDLKLFKKASTNEELDRIFSLIRGLI